VAPTVFSGRTADEVWRAAAQAVAGEDGAAQASQHGDTREVLHCVLSVADPRSRWVLARQPTLNPALALAEVLVILTGRQDAEFLLGWSKAYGKYNGLGPTYRGSYGYRLRYKFGVDQVQQAINALRHKGDSRQVVLQIWDVTSDLPDSNGDARLRDTPCNLLSLLKLRGGSLHWTQVLRSNDLYRGVPYNFVQFMTLQEIIAAEVGAELGTYDHWSDSLHVYADLPEEARHAREFVAPAGRALPQLGGERQAIVDRLTEHVDDLRANGVTDSVASYIAAGANLPDAYADWLRVFGVEAARRARALDISNKILQSIGDPALREVTTHWLQEHHGGARQLEE
jgi:thymidylate synthase